jgi:hypothetical protein
MNFPNQFMFRSCDHFAGSAPASFQLGGAARHLRMSIVEYRAHPRSLAVYVLSRILRQGDLHNIAIHSTSAARASLQVMAPSHLVSWSDRLD